MFFTVVPTLFILPTLYTKHRFKLIVRFKNSVQLYFTPPIYINKRTNTDFYNYVDVVRCMLFYKIFCDSVVCKSYFGVLYHHKTHLLTASL